MNEDKIESQVSDEDSWIDGSCFPEEDRQVLFIPKTDYISNYKSYRLRLGLFLKKDSFGRDNMFCDGAFFEAYKVIWQYAPQLPTIIRMKEIASEALKTITK